MNMTEINDKINKLANAWESFKDVNDQRLKQIEQKKSSDPLFDEQLKNINEALNDYKNKIDDIEISMQRPESDSEFKYSNKSEYEKAFEQYLRKGQDVNLSRLEQKSLSVESDPNGGYLVTREQSKNITKAILEKSPMRQLASVETISTDSLDVIEDSEALMAGWTSESDSREDTETSKIFKKRILVHELYAQPKATQKLIDDASINIEKWLAEKIIDIFAQKENEAFIKGDGIEMPRGILNYKEGKEWGAVEAVKADSITAEALMVLYFSLKSSYIGNASFIMNKSTLQTIRTLKDESGRYIWLPGLAIGRPDALLGAPVFEAVDMPDATKGAMPIAFANFKSAYKIVDRIGIRVLRDPFTNKPFVKFYTTKRVGGDVINYEAIKLLKTTA
jgi:HK97 family phage major capsid protein